MMQKKVMVVDDETNIRFVLKRMLEKGGYDVIEARNGIECLDLLSKERPDLIILDVMMPGMDGWETCARIKNDEKTKDITVSMLSVKKAHEDKINSLEDSLADWHISKPIDRDELISTVKWLLDSPPRRE
jgi:CheY-like chemotaxis protein